MAEILLTFQSQLSGVMETVFKAAIYEITRLVEDSFVEEVIRCREQVESLERRLKAAESRRTETQEVGKERCADCGRVCSSGEGKATMTEKSLKQESVLPEEAQSSQDASGGTPSEEMEEANPNAYSSTKAKQASGGRQDKTVKLLKEEPLQRAAEVGESRSWNIGTDETDASCLPGSSKHFSEQNTKAQVNWESGFDQRPDLSQDGHTGGSSEPPVQNRFGINDLGGFNKTEHGDSHETDMGNFVGLQSTKSHTAAGVSYVDQYNEDVEGPEGAEHNCYPANSPQSRRVESSAARSPLKTNCDVSGQLSCLFIDEEGYLQDLNVRYADQESGGSGSRRGFYGQDIRFNPSVDGTENMYEPSEAYSNTLHLGNRLQHQTAESGGGSHILHQCFASLTDSVALKTYKQINKSAGAGPPYSSNQCGKTFPQACNPKVHPRVPTGQELHLCSHCGKGFPSFATLKSHKCGQTSDKPYCCPVCGNKFSRLWNLKLHQRIHTQEKPHRCGMCEKSFTRADILKVHQRTHTGERPYCCSICDLSFKRLDHLKSHQRKHITDL